MQVLLQNMERRMNDLRQIIMEKEMDLMKVPEGTVHIARTDKHTHFYFREQDGRRRYMKESESEQVRKLCQKDYDQKVLTSAKQELKDLEKLYQNYCGKSPESIYGNMHEERKKLISPIWLPDEEYAKQWETMMYRPKGFRENTPEFYTDKGERVRSKTEILIANALQKYQIPYRYEAPLKIQNHIIYPDFTILHKRLRKEMYWEHMGMMDDEEYREYALERINWYEKSDIFPGERLILTHETQKKPIHSKIIEKLVLHYLI